MKKDPSMFAEYNDEEIRLDQTLILNANECSIFSHFDEPREEREDSDSEVSSTSTLSIQEHDP